MRTIHWLSLSFVALVALGVACTSVSKEIVDDTSARTHAADDDRRQVTVLFVADLHARMKEHPELFWHGGEERIETAGGFARLAQAIREIREERKGDVLVLDGGDTFQGSGVAAETEGKALVPALNAIGFDLAIPGNWEVVYGRGALEARARELDYPMIASNLRTAENGALLFRPYYVKEVAGVRVAVIGYTDPDVPFRQPPAYSEGLTFDGDAELQALIDEVRAKERPDVLLLASHIGLARAAALTDRVTGVDVHLSSDTHERTYEPIVRNGTWVVEPGAFGSLLGRLDLWVKDGEVVDQKWELIELTASRFGEDPHVADLVEEAHAPFAAALDRVVGITEIPLMRYAVVDNSLDQLIADAVREATGTEIGLSNGFRFGSPILAGPITQADLWASLPVVTNLKVGKVTGRQLKDFWEREIENVFTPEAEKRFGGWLPRPSGMTMSFRVNAKKGERVLSLEVNGEPVEEDRLYTIAACEREGDADDALCRISGVKEPRVLEIDVHEAVRRHLAKGPVKQTGTPRVVAVDMPPVLRSQPLPD